MKVTASPETHTMAGEMGEANQKTRGPNQKREIMQAKDVECIFQLDVTGDG